MFQIKNFLIFEGFWVTRCAPKSLKTLISYLNKLNLVQWNSLILHMKDLSIIFDVKKEKGFFDDFNLNIIFWSQRKGEKKSSKFGSENFHGALRLFKFSKILRQKNFELLKFKQLTHKK